MNNVVSDWTRMCYAHDINVTLFFGFCFNIKRKKVLKKQIQEIIWIDISIFFAELKMV